ncbi:AsnC family transcriptional regulator [Acidothermaceae bacterium B102]|nr:AsnC family transcriptional regulator [Acidothermaceae bacterium B102]
MDRIDRQIIHCLQRDGRASFRRMADVLGVSEQTVARRYRSLVSDGAIRLLVLTDARASGDQAWFVRIVCRPDAADALAEAIAARDDVSWVTVTSGGSELSCVTRSDPDDHSSVLLQRLPRTAQVLSFTAHSVMYMHIGGDAEWLAFDDPLTDAQVEALTGGEAPPRTGSSLPTALRDEDRPLLNALSRDGRAGVVELARTTGWPQSRVSSRLDELLSTGAIGCELDLAPDAFGFRASAYLWMTVPPGELHATGEALSRHPETSFAAAVTGAANLLAVVTCKDAAALYTYVTTKVGALPAVRELEIVPTLRRVKQAGTLMRNGRLVLAPRQ